MFESLTHKSISKFEPSIVESSIEMAIGFKQLAVFCHIGTNPGEKQKAQKIYISLSVTLKSIPHGDDLMSTINYASLAELCRQTCTERPRELIETLARDLLDVISSRFEVSKVKITVEKPAAFTDAICSFAELEKNIEATPCVGR
jgi:dihydroneopterin aldolase